MRLTRRKVLVSVAALASLVAGGFGTRAALARYHDGPVSDHFDGVRFFDPHGMPPKKLTDVVRWWAAGGKSPWPASVPNGHADRPPARVEGNRARISFVGHASFLIQVAGANILLDPVWSDRVSPFSFLGPRRVRPPGIAFADLPPIDVVLVSHCHYDHLDLATLSQLAAAHRPRVIAPLGNDAIMLAHDPSIGVETCDWGDRIDLGNGVAVTLAPMRHWSARGVFDRNKALWAAFIIDTPAGRIYHVGDSGYGDGHHFRPARERFGPFRLAILPIGAYVPRWFMRDQHMNPGEAVQAWQDCGAEHALAHHFETFPLTDEPIDAPRRALAAALDAAGNGAGRFRMLEPGQVWEL
jgi:L-ascorbate metabolism protein UlaG (beta-lactamase superfamily)